VYPHTASTYAEGRRLSLRAKNQIQPFRFRGGYIDSSRRYHQHDSIGQTIDVNDTLLDIGDGGLGRDGVGAGKARLDAIRDLERDIKEAEELYQDIRVREEATCSVANATYHFGQSLLASISFCLREMEARGMRDAELLRDHQTYLRTVSGVGRMSIKALRFQLRNISLDVQTHLDILSPYQVIFSRKLVDISSNNTSMDDILSKRTELLDDVLSKRSELLDDVLSRDDDLNKHNHHTHQKALILSKLREVTLRSQDNFHKARDDLKTYFQIDWLGSQKDPNMTTNSLYGYGENDSSCSFLDQGVGNRFEWRMEMVSIRQVRDRMLQEAPQNEKDVCERIECLEEILKHLYVTEMSQGFYQKLTRQIKEYSCSNDIDTRDFAYCKTSFFKFIHIAEHENVIPYLRRARDTGSKFVVMGSNIGWNCFFATLAYEIPSVGYESIPMLVSVARNMYLREICGRARSYPINFIQMDPSMASFKKVKVVMLDALGWTRKARSRMYFRLVSLLDLGAIVIDSVGALGDGFFGKFFTVKLSLKWNAQESVFVFEKTRLCNIDPRSLYDAVQKKAAKMGISDGMNDQEVQQKMDDLQVRESLFSSTSDVED